MWKKDISCLATVAVLLQHASASTGRPCVVSSHGKVVPPTTTELAPSAVEENRTYVVEEGGLVDYNLVPWDELNEWLSYLNGNIHAEQHAVFLKEKGVTTTKLFDDLERRFQNKTEVTEEIDLDKSYSVEEMDLLAKKNSTAFLLIREREKERVQGRGKVSPAEKIFEASDEEAAINSTNSPEEGESNKTASTKVEDNDCEGDEESDDKTALRLSLGYGKDWKRYQNPQGYTHFEELLIYQPRYWKMHAREYMLRFDGDIDFDATVVETANPSKGSKHDSPQPDATTPAFLKRHVLKRLAIPAGGQSDLERNGSTFQRMASLTLEGFKNEFPIRMRTPISVVLLHPEIDRCDRYEPLSFLLAYEAKNPLIDMIQELKSMASQQDQDKLVDEFLAELSPLDYFFDFSQQVQAYSLENLRKMGTAAGFPRLCFIKEFDFGEVIGQRVAKQIVRSEVVRFVWDRITEPKYAQKQPLSMIFAGPSGVGKTELAVELAKLVNRQGLEEKPRGDNFLKVDCGKLTYASEVFGLSGSYVGSEQGSALNNFIVRKSRDNGTLGIVLLDEIEKASQEVIHALYRKCTTICLLVELYIEICCNAHDDSLIFFVSEVLDKGEWTNKRLESGVGAQTQVVSCRNIIFILTTNAATDVIEEHARGAQVLYTAASAIEAQKKQQELEFLLRCELQSKYPFTDAFIARVDRIVPFLPMARGVDPAIDHPLMAEAMTVAKMLIEKEQNKLQNADLQLSVIQTISARNKHSMAKLAVAGSIEEAGVRSIQKYVATAMGHQMKHALLLKDGGIASGSEVRYAADEETMMVDWRLEASPGKRKKGDD
ncbi:MAG: hypothetical protein SGILL_007677 [Bacillariaceae sp.]